MIAVALASLSLFTVSTPAGAQGLPDGGPVPSDPTFTALRIDGTSVSGQVRQISREAGLVLVTGPGQEQTVPLDAMVKLGRVALPATPDPAPSLVLFPERDRLYARGIGGINATNGNLDVLAAALGNVAIPSDRVLGLIFALPTARDAAESLVTQVRSEPRTSELLWIGNGDRLVGGLLALDEKSISFQPATGKVELARSGVVALGFDPKLATYPRPEGLYLELTLLDGSRIGVTAPRVEQGSVVATARFGAEVRVPLADLAAAHVLGGAVSYLSDREATGAQYETYVGPTQPYRRDLNVAGHPIRLGGQSYDRGLGTQSRTLLAYRLEPGAKRFQATIGLDDSAGPLGSVAFKVLLDGVDKVRYTSPVMAAREAPRSIDVDVSGGRLLILITEFGDRGNVQDLADWAEARIIR